MWVAARVLRSPGAVLRGVPGGRDAVAPCHARGLRGSTVFCGSKNLLKKFASKTRKKFWYEGPSLGSPLTHRPSKLELLKTTPRKARKEDHVRLWALNGLLYKALTDLLSTPEVSQEVYDLNVELSKVALTPDFSACRVYWKTSLSADQNARTQAILQKSAAYIRHLLMSQQTLRNVPPIVFVQDRKNAALAEVDRLLAIADLGPKEGSEDSTADARDTDALPPQDPPGPATPFLLLGIDHDALNKQVVEYKQRKEKGLMGASLQPSGQGQVAELPQQARRRRKALVHRHLDTSPRSFLLGKENEESEDEDEDQDGALGCRCPAQDAAEGWAAEPESGQTGQH
ncbi:putative ribosome-binding factor A, mitochondrial [Ctenodactylus gundi]